MISLPNKFKIQDFDRSNQIIDEIYNKKEYDCWDIQQDWNIIDLGAHQGLYCFYVVNFCKSILAIEILQSNYVQLINNIEINNLVDKISALNLGVWEYNGTRQISGSNLDGNLINDSSEFIDVLTLDSIIENSKFDKVHLLKVDIEGSEEALIKGMNKFLPERISIATYHKHIFPNVISKEQIIEQLIAKIIKM